MSNYIKEAINSANNPSVEIRDKFLKRFEEGNPTRDEESKTHFCVYFLPYNPKTKELFLVHHKKAGIWISPGGHIDKDETPIGALEREVKEELGVVYKAEGYYKVPFLLTITPIDNVRQPCKAHYDIWYLMPTDGSNFNIDPAEFHETKWFTLAEAEAIVTEPSNIEALNIIRKL